MKYLILFFFVSCADKEYVDQRNTDQLRYIDGLREKLERLERNFDHYAESNAEMFIVIDLKLDYLKDKKKPNLKVGCTERRPNRQEYEFFKWIGDKHAQGLIVPTVDAIPPAAYTSTPGCDCCNRGR